MHSNKCRCNVVWHHCPLHRIDPPHHNLQTARRKSKNGKIAGTKKNESQSSIRTAPLIEDANPQAAKRPTLTKQNQQLRGPMLEMQMRVRQKASKRKEVEAESTANKRRCDREERIAKVQLQAYWDLYPLPARIVQAEGTPAPDSDDDELIEAQSHETSVVPEIGTHSESEQELIVHDDNNAICMRSKAQRSSCHRGASSSARCELLKTLQSSIDGKAEADAKRRKLDPVNSRAGTDPKVINRDVEQTCEDPLNTRIRNRELRASTKRACLFDELAQSCKTSKREVQAIQNICDSGKS